MVACGFGMVGLALWGCWLLFRRRLDRRIDGSNVWFLRATVAAPALPYLGVWVGWWTREVGRQPWVVFGMMRTADGVSHMSVALELVWLLGYAAFELTVWASTWWFLAKVIRQGPNLDSPVVRGGHELLGTLSPGAGTVAGEKETPKAEEAVRPGRMHPA